VLVIVGRRYFARDNRPGEQPFLNDRAARLVGGTYVLTKPIVDGHGQIKVDDTNWRVTGPDLPSGSKVQVAGPTDRSWRWSGRSRRGRAVGSADEPAEDAVEVAGEALRCDAVGDFRHHRQSPLPLGRAVRIGESRQAIVDVRFLGRLDQEGIVGAEKCDRVVDAAVDQDVGPTDGGREALGERAERATLLFQSRSVRTQ